MPKELLAQAATLVAAQANRTPKVARRREEIPPRRQQLFACVAARRPRLWLDLPEAKLALVPNGARLAMALHADKCR